MDYRFKNPRMRIARQRFANHLSGNPSTGYLIHETEYQRFAQSGEDEPSSLKIYVSEDVTLLETILDVCIEDATHFAHIFDFRKVEERGWTVWIL